jgi:hypothetical protein
LSAVDFVIGRLLVRDELPDKAFDQLQHHGDSLDDLLTRLAADWT